MAKRSPSPAFLLSIEAYDDDDIEEAIDAIREVIKAQDGHMAYKIIEQWHDHGVAGVLAYVLNQPESEQTII